MTFDLVNNIVPVRGLAAQKLTATTLSAKADLRAYESVVATLDVGAFGDSQSGSVYFEGEVQESADDVTYAAVADSDLLFPVNRISPLTNGYKARTGTATGTFFQSKTTGSADISGVYQVGYRGSKRYIKVNIRVTGSNSTGTVFSVVFQRSHGEFKPSVINYPAV